MNTQRLGVQVLAPFLALALALGASCSYDFSLKTDGSGGADGAGAKVGVDASGVDAHGADAYGGVDAHGADAYGGVDAHGGADAYGGVDAHGADAYGGVDTGAPDVPMSADTGEDSAHTNSDASLVLDTNTQSHDDAPLSGDASVAVPVDAPVELPHCGGCCANADCPLSAPVCGSDNKCTKCLGDPDCAGRSATACHATSGACVSCTKNSQCGGATAACDTSANRCVGCTQRRDCPGACQTCTNASCVPVKNVDDQTKCAGTCDSNGECKGKEGQSCSVTSDCIAGTTCASDKICRANPCATLANGSPCGSGKVCNVETCQDGCWIAGAFVASGGGNASNICQICVPSRSTTAWSNDDSKAAISCGNCGGTAACVGGTLSQCSANAGTFYPDADGDGYGAATGALTACSKPVRYADNNKDCCDNDVNAFPGQAKTFSTANGCGSFDYNCDGQETPKSNGPTSCGADRCVPSSSGTTCVQMGCEGCGSDCARWTIAACGETYYVSVSTCFYGGGSCQGSGNGGPYGTQECN